MLDEDSYLTTPAVSNHWAVTSLTAGTGEGGLARVWEHVKKYVRYSAREMLKALMLSES